MTVKTIAKVSGIPDAEIAVTTDGYQGEFAVIASVRAVYPMDSKVVLRLALSPEAACELGRRLLEAASDAMMQQGGST